VAILHPGLAHVDQAAHKFLTNVELTPKNLGEIIHTQCITKPKGTDGPNVGIAKSSGASVADGLQKH
jgi:hypothetical protein